MFRGERARRAWTYHEIIENLLVSNDILGLKDHVDPGKVPRMVLHEEIAILHEEN